MADEREIAAYYDRGNEQGRLADWGRLECAAHARAARAPPAARRPPPCSTSAARAGAYALPLAAEGYEVHLVDPVALHVEQARAASAAQPETPLASAARGDARDAAVRRRERRRRPHARPAATT